MLSIIAILVIIILIFYYKDRINPIISKYVSASIVIPAVPSSITALIPNSNNRPVMMGMTNKDHGNVYRNIRMKEAGVSIEDRMQGQHAEHFTPEDVGVTYMNDEEKDNENSTFIYGDKDADFSDYLKGQAVDKEVIKNHKKFMSEKKYSQGNIRFAPDMNESYNPIPWTGLRRPQAVPVGNPDQVPDVDREYYNTPESSQVWRF